MYKLWTGQQGQEGAGLSLSAKIAGVLILSILLWSVGLPTLLTHVEAASFSLIQDTISTSNPGVLAKHTIVYNNATSTSAGQTIKIMFDQGPTHSAFTEAFSSATTTDFSATGFNLVTNAAACSGTASEAYPIGNYNNGTDENITFTVCPGDTIPAGVITIGIGTTTKLITNPSSVGSYPITITGTQDNNGETRVAIIPAVTLTASVNTAFTFSVSGLATTTGFYGNLATTTGSTTATSLPFSTLNQNTQYILGQQLSVVTNARNGFAVTVQENQPPTSSSGSTIDLFSNGASSSVPILWTAPTSVIGIPSSYGHFGVTSDDTDETVGNEFATSTKWAGNIDNPRVVFSAPGPADGTTQNFGTAKVGYSIQIGPLQEAGTDYTNTITYVATPTF